VSENRRSSSNVSSPSAVAAPPDVFVTETMAELSARQGRTAEAVAIYRRLIERAPAQDERRPRWADRLATLERAAAAGEGAATPPAPGAAASARAAAPARVTAPAAEPALRPPLVVQQQVRSGQVVYAERGDLIVLAPVNPGAQLMADGNIHVYGPLRGRAVAGVRGCATAQVFCLRLEAELVGVDAAYLTYDQLPPPHFGGAARVWLEDGSCRVAALWSAEAAAGRRPL